MKTKDFWLLLAVAVCSTSARGQEFVWTQSSAPNKQWQFVTASFDGTKMMAAANSPTSIHVSTNSALTWTQSAAPAVIQWFCGASSADGTKLVAADNINWGIYTSTNTGLTWTKTSAATNQSWWSIASSSDGNKLVAGSGGSVNGSGLYLSTNSGLTWTKASWPTNGSYRVASSSDGTKLVAAELDGKIYTSANSGLSWITTSAPSNTWYDVASSSDGSKLAAVAVRAGIWTSTNSGVTWAKTSAPSTNWFRLSSSSDGTRLVAATLGPQVGGRTTGAIFCSTNSGLTWTQTSVTNLAWVALASSSDGTKLVAASSYGAIYTAYIPTNPPSIAQQPRILASCPGSSAVLGVTVTGTPPFDYQWRKAGTNLVDGGNVSGATTTNLTLLNVSQSDAANYNVVITNIVGSVTSSVAILIVASVPAKATPVIFNGFIVGAILTDGGCGYTNSPIIVFSGQGGSGAAGYGQISNGSVTNIIMTSAGIGYPTNTVAQVAPPFFPTMSIALTNTPAATATPIIINGFVVGANLTASGSAYTIPPAVTFSDGSGAGATGYAQISNGSVTNIVITSAGSGYSSNTVINIPPAAYQNAVIPSANSLMLGQNFQLQIANALDSWTNYGVAFFATNNAWTSPDYWVVADAARVFFRLRLLP